MTPNRRVVVTGVGLVSPVGIGTEETWQALLAGRSGAGPITLFDASHHSTRFACEVKGFDPLRFIEKKEVKKVDRFIQFAIAAADFALQDASFTVDGPDAARVGVFIGSGIGGFATIEREHSALLEGGPRRISPFFIPAAIVNLAAGWVSIRTGAKGPNSATATACTSGAHAVGDSFRLIQHGDADAMICGGSEAAITPLGVGGFCAMRALSTRNDAPGEGLAPVRQGPRRLRDRGGRRHPRPRGARARAPRGARGSTAEVVGYGMSGDAYHISAPSEDGDGAVRVMRATLEDAGVAPDAVDYINVHGTSTPRGRRGGDDRHQDRLRRARPAAGPELHEVDDRAPARAPPAASRPASSPSRSATRSCRPPSTTTTPTPSATSTACRTRPARPRSATRSATRSASAARTARSSSSATRPEKGTPMKIVVCVKQVPDTETRVKIAAVRQRHLRGRRRQLDRLALRRVRDRGGAADQGGEGRGGGRWSRSGPTAPRPPCAPPSPWAPTAPCT